MPNKKKVRRRKISLVDKYEYGSYVIQNQPIPTVNKTNTGATAISTAASGASLGFTVGGPIGAAIGGGLGLVGGILSGNKRRKAERAQQRQLTQDSLDAYGDQYNNMISETQDPLGVYQDGGDILDNTINIEKGELQVDPESGKILREFKGFNPETGGKYEEHSSKGKDTKHNNVTAEAGTFIITKDKSTEYKKALENNDKLSQNTIMHNIRKNKRKSLSKFQDGGNVLPPIDFRAGYAGITPNTVLSTGNITSLPQITTNATVNSSVGSNNNFNYGNLLGLLPAATNLLQGSQSPDYMSYSNSPANRYTDRILSNMPNDINYSPLINRIYRDRNTAYRQIGDTTSSSAIARANRQNLYANTQRGIQDVYFQGEDYNNRIRGQRAGIYSQLGQDDYQRFSNDRQYNYNIDMTNRQMDVGRRGQFLTGISQIGQYQNQLNVNRQVQNREQQMLGLLGAMNPYSEQFISRFMRGGRNG